jgi:hypothetical protein
MKTKMKCYSFRFGGIGSEFRPGIIFAINKKKAMKALRKQTKEETGQNGICSSLDSFVEIDINKEQIIRNRI